MYFGIFGIVLPLLCSVCRKSLVFAVLHIIHICTGNMLLMSPFSCLMCLCLHAVLFFCSFLCLRAVFHLFLVRRMSLPTCCSSCPKMWLTFWVCMLRKAVISLCFVYWQHGGRLFSNIMGYGSLHVTLCATGDMLLMSLVPIQDWCFMISVLTMFTWLILYWGSIVVLLGCLVVWLSKLEGAYPVVSASYLYFLSCYLLWRHA